jgi:alanine-glyoxylate transaminase / serine-glyoxylate transaminase / serine-pyruvate transaminase
MDRPTIDHRGPDFKRMALEIFAALKPIFQTAQPVVIYPASGTGAWEAALVNTLSPGDKVLMFETGHFATLWREIALRLGLTVDWVPGKLAHDRGHEIKAVAVVHNETSTGVTSRIPALREAMNRAAHPALLLVDTISSLASMDYRHDEWGVDVTVAGSQKGLMLPPGLSFNAISEKARRASSSARLAKAYWAWEPMLSANQAGFFPFTPATNLLYGLQEAIAMLLEEGLANVFARHHRHAEATRRAARAWGLQILCARADEYSSTLTALMLPDGHDSDALREVILERFNLSLGQGLGKVKGKVFRIGHLGDFNDLTLAGTLCGVEMGLALAGVPHAKGGVAAALDYLSSERTAAGAAG